MRRRLRRWAHHFLLTAGVVYVLNLAIVAWLWRHRGAVVQALADAAADLGRLRS